MLSHPITSRLVFPKSTTKAPFQHWFKTRRGALQESVPETFPQVTPSHYTAAIKAATRVWNKLHML